MTRSLHLGLLLAALATVPALAAGIYQGLPQAAPPLTGNELLPADTGIGAGSGPQTELISSASLSAYVLGTATGSATASAGAATLNGRRGSVTSESLSVAAGADYVLTLANSAISTGSIVLVSVANGSNSTEGIAVNRVQPSAGALLIHIRNGNASAVLNGTIQINFFVVA